MSTLINTKYPTHFEAVPDSYSFVPESEVQMIDIAAGAGQGIRYVCNGGKKISVVFRSDTLEDIHQVRLNGGWSNTVSATDVYPGITVYVIGNAKIRKKFPGTVGIRYTLKSLPYKESLTDKQWASEQG